MSFIYDNSKIVCKLCNLKTLAVFDKNKKKFIDVHVSKLKGTVDWNGYLFCDRQSGPATC